MGYRFVAIAIENGGLLSDTTLGLLDELTNRLPANDRLRFNTFARMKLSATIALGTARLIKERLPIRIGSDGRVLPTGAAAVPLLGPPPRGPSLMRRRPNPRIELVPEPEPERFLDCHPINFATQLISKILTRIRDYWERDKERERGAMKGS